MREPHFSVCPAPNTVTRLCWVLLCLAALLSGSAAAGARTAEDNPAFLVGEYKLPAAFDSTVAVNVKTELWAAVFRPSASGRYPLLVFLHGNHGTCGQVDPELGIRIDDSIDYTFSGTCPAGYVPTPNHRGYDYLAAKLAAQGYVVVSINANRGVTGADGLRSDFGLNLRRGRLVLRHLQQLADWNAGRTATPAGLGFSLQGLIDFGHVGLLGHSRGGEGMRAAIAQYRDLKSPWPKRIGNVNFEALFEIGPVDGQTSRTLDAEGVAWNVLLPGCDGDVSDLRGVRPFDRMIMRSAERRALPKSSFEVFGANHNFYNTEWQATEHLTEKVEIVVECGGQTPLFPLYPGSEPQRRTAENTVIPFFRAHVGAVKLGALADRFDPSRPLPPELTEITGYARGHTANLRRVANFVIDDFTGKTGRSSRGVANTPYRLTQYLHGDAGLSHDPSQRAALVGWSTPDAYLQVNAAKKPLKVNTAVFKTLEFRVKLECHDSLCNQNMNPAGDVDFSVRLVTGTGTPSVPVKLSSVAQVYRPVSSVPAPNNSVFQTVRIPLSAFGGADMSQFRGVRFAFDQTPRGLVSLGNVRLVQAEASPPGAPPPAVAGSVPAASRASPPAREINQVVAVRPAVPESATRSGAGQAGVVEIELASTRRFPVMDSLPTLYIGDREYRWSRFVAGAANRIVFSLDEAEFRQLPDVSDMRLAIGGAPVWNFGQFRRP